MYKLKSNAVRLESVAIEFGDACSTLIVRDEGSAHSMQVGYAACGAWTAEDIYEVRGCYYEGVFCPVLRFHYTNDGLQLQVEPNVSWAPITVTTITGRVAGEIA